MEVTFLRLTSVSFALPRKAYAPILVMLLGEPMVVSSVQDSKAEAPISVTLSGRVIAVRAIQSKKASLPIATYSPRSVTSESFCEPIKTPAGIP